MYVKRLILRSGTMSSYTMDGEDLVLMLRSLGELRVQLQTAGISTLSNPLVREIFEEMKKDLEWVEETAGFIPQFTGPAQNLLAQHTLRLLNERASLSPNSIKQAANPNMSGSRKTEIDQLTRPIDLTIERSGWPKRVSKEEFIATLTIIWIFASIDTARMRLLSDVEILRKIREQESL